MDNKKLDVLRNNINLLDDKILDLLKDRAEIVTEIGEQKKSHIEVVDYELDADKDNEILIGSGSIEATDSEGKVINADKITYEKTKEFILVEGKVKISDSLGNILKTDKATYDKIIDIITTYNLFRFFDTVPRRKGMYFYRCKEEFVGVRLLDL
mgnify:CR=1 FL=1